MTAPVSPLSSLRTLLALTGKDEVTAATKGIQCMSRDQLRNRMMRARIAFQTAAEIGGRVSKQNRLSMWLFNEECTRRGIPPVLRDLPYLNDDDAEQVGDLFAFDLQWLAVRYPKHQTLAKQWQGIFRESTFHSTAQFVCNGNYPRRQIWWFCQRLALTEDQQREMHLIKGARYENELGRLNANLPDVKAKLSRAYHARDSRYKTSDHAATINRRVNVWFIGSLADWKPQRTANLYEIYTGEAITRQQVANVIAQVHRDLPEVRPKRTRKVSKS